MFYSENFTPNKLRFGDVIKGYIESLPVIDKPFCNSQQKEYKYSIESSLSEFSVIMTPCCNIENKIVSLTPLCKIPKTLFRNPYFVKDFTILNREIEPEKTLPPNNWLELNQEEKEKRLSKGLQYAFNYFFFYKEYDLLPEYDVQISGNNYKTRSYLIDFRHIYPSKCEGITKEKIHEEILCSKFLELDVYTRKELRDKLANYYGRPADVDKVTISSI